MMTPEQTSEIIDWLREYVNRMKDREDYDALQEHIDRLEQSIKELEDRIKCSLLEA